MPLVGSDRARVDSLRTMAQEVADFTGQSMKLAAAAAVKFSVREDLEDICP